MVARAVIAHWISGRVRLLIPDKRGDAEYFRKLSSEFSDVNGLQKVKVNPTTGSLILEFTGGVEGIVQRALMRDLFRIDAMKIPQDAPASLGLDTNPIHLVSNRKIDAMFMLASALGAAGVVQIMRGKIFSPALALFWYAQQAFRQSGNQVDAG